MHTCRITLTGTTPLLMHNQRLADPLDPFAKAMKALNGKRSKDKTDDDRVELARLEFLGGLYHHDQLGPYLPAENIKQSIIGGAKLSRDGRSVDRAVIMIGETEMQIAPLLYTGPRKADELWEDENFRNRSQVIVGQNRVTRCRPMFREWSCVVDALYDPNMIDFEKLQRVTTAAGLYAGVGDWRPRFGRYTAEVVDTTEEG
jgi:hypothetical protein